MHWLQPQSTPCVSSPKFLNRLCLTIFSRLRSSLLLVHLFLPHFSLPVNFPWTCFDTALCEQPCPFSDDLLWLTLLVEGVDDRLLDNCQVSSLPSDSGCVYWTRPRDTRYLYCMNSNLLKLKIKYSNILRYLFLSFLSCRLQLSKLKWKKKLETF